MLAHAFKATLKVICFGFLLLDDTNSLFLNTSSILEAHFFIWIGALSVIPVSLLALVIVVLDREANSSMQSLTVKHAVDKRMDNSQCGNKTPFISALKRAVLLNHRSSISAPTPHIKSVIAPANSNQIKIIQIK